MRYFMGQLTTNHDFGDVMGYNWDISGIYILIGWGIKLDIVEM
jgi:hypothetical protein